VSLPFVSWLISKDFIKHKGSFEAIFFKPWISL